MEFQGISHQSEKRIIGPMELVVIVTLEVQ